MCDEVVLGEVYKSGSSNRTDKGVISQGATTFRRGSSREIINQDVIHTNPMCPCYLMDEQSGVSKSVKRTNPSIRKDTSTLFNAIGVVNTGEGEYNDKGGASRFFYQAKVSKAERNMGLDAEISKNVRPQGEAFGNGSAITDVVKGKGNNHPTVKPVSLMAYLCRLITPPNGIVLDPFMGSGSTGIAAQLEGFRFCGMEMDADYFKIAEARINNYEGYRKFIK